MKRREPGNAEAETDDRFPAGPWNGFFLQPRCSSDRKNMSLHLSFIAGEITGDGDGRWSRSGVAWGMTRSRNGVRVRPWVSRGALSVIRPGRRTWTGD